METVLVTVQEERMGWGGEGGVGTETDDDYENVPVWRMGDIGLRTHHHC